MSLANLRRKVDQVLKTSYPHRDSLPGNIRDAIDDLMRARTDDIQRHLTQNIDPFESLETRHRGYKP